MITDCTAIMRECDLKQLALQNEVLTAELAQCQADKDFVWSLWKRLQVSNPDVTEAMSLVVQREKEKSEAKDRKVLEILQVKDDRIEELQNIVAKQSQEISDLLSRKVELTEKNGLLEIDLSQLQDRVDSLQSQIRIENKKEQDFEDTFRKTIEGSEKEKYELNCRVSHLMTELEVTKSERDHSVTRQKLLEERVKCLEQEMSQKMEKFEELISEIEDSSNRLSSYENQASQMRRDLGFKNQELENVRKELRELWTAHNQLTDHSGQQADLIRQLQSLQQDTQKMMKNQEDAFSVESSSLQQMFNDVNSRYETSKRIEAELRQQVLELKKSLMEKDDVILSLKSVLPEEANLDQSGMSKSEYNASFFDIVQEIENLDSSNLNKNDNQRVTERSPTRQSRPKKTGEDTPNKRSRSLSSSRGDINTKRSASITEFMLERTKTALELKDQEVKELRRSHDQRLERLRSLQKSYKQLKDEMRQQDGLGKKQTKKIKRANPRSLQNENSDEVWNELAFFKSENRSLQIDKMALQEELDLLRVQTSSDAATVHELSLKLQETKDEYEFKIRGLERDKIQNRNTETQLSTLKSQLQQKIAHNQRLERDLTNALSQRDGTSQEKSKLVSQLLSTQQDASTHRIELANLKHELQSLRRHLEENRDTIRDLKKEKENMQVVSQVATNLIKKRKSRDAKKYQNSLNHSIEKMATVFNEFNEEGWEEVSDDSVHGDEASESSLGDKIVNRSQTQGGGESGKKLTVKPRRTPTARLSSSFAKNLNKKSVAASSPSSRARVVRSPRSSSPKQIVLREFATSPISFDEPEVDSQKTPLKRSSTACRTMRHNSGLRLSNLRQRIASLQAQVEALRLSKKASIQTEATLRETVDKLTNELTSTTNRLKASKQTVQKLQGEITELQKEQKSKQISATKLDESEEESHQIKILETKLKAANSETCRQTAALKSLKTELESSRDSLKALQERNNHLERDVNQKRTLLESQKIKLKHVQDISKTDTNTLEELQTKIKLLNDANNKQKVQLDSFKKRLAVITKDKKEYEDKYLKSALQVEQKTKQLSDATSKKNQLEKALNELEKAAQQHLHGLATQSEAAIDSAKEKLSAAQNRLAQFQMLIKILATELVERVNGTKSKIREAQIAEDRSHREANASLQKAADKARDILNLSHSDLEDILSADGDAESVDFNQADDKKNDKRWIRKCEKLMASKEDFVHPLITLLLQKVDERTNLVSSSLVKM